MNTEQIPETPTFSSLEIRKTFFSNVDNVILAFFIALLFIQDLLVALLVQAHVISQSSASAIMTYLYWFGHISIFIAYLIVVIRKIYQVVTRKRPIQSIIFDLLVIVLLSALYQQEMTPIYVLLVRHGVFLALFYFSFFRSQPFFTRSRLGPVQIFALVFLLIIFLGTILLSLPISQVVDDTPVYFVDALFTAVSAISVTGLVVVDTGHDYNLLGQIIIMLLIQVGGLGIMTFAGLITLLAGQNVSIRERRLMIEFIGDTYKDNFKRLIVWIVNFALITEAIAAVALFWVFRAQLGEIPELQSYFDVVFYSIFYAISGFCNAGFTLFSDSLNQYVHLSPILYIIIITGIMGSTGFLTIHNLVEIVKYKLFPARFPIDRKRLLTENSRVVLSTTFWIWIIGTLLFLLLEQGSSLAGLSFPEQVTNAFFKSSIGRTAGFTGHTWEGITTSSCWLMIIFMFFGGSPGSVAGGVKITALFLLIVALKAYLTRSSLVVYKRSIPKETIFRLCALVCLGAVLIFFVTVVLMISENKPFLPVLFEATSAFATVGLSLGITPELSPFGKIVISGLMFIGRVGPPIFVLITEEIRPLSEAKLPRADIFIG